MAETDWARAYDPAEMLEGLRTTTQEKLLWGYVLRCLAGVGAEAEAVVLQAYLAGDVDAASLAAHRYELEMTAGIRHGGGSGRKPVSIRQPALRARAALAAFQTSAWDAAEQVTRETRHELQRQQCAWLRCLFANPFGAVLLDLRWLSSTVTELVKMIEEGQRGVMPILGDALIDAGCDHVDVIQHCQSAEEHDPNCWFPALLLASQPRSDV